MWDMPTRQSKQTLYLPYLNKITVQNNNKLFTTITEYTIDQSTFTFKYWMRDMTTNLAVISEFDNLTFLSRLRVTSLLSLVFVSDYAADDLTDRVIESQ